MVGKKCGMITDNIGIHTLRTFANIESLTENVRLSQEAVKSQQISATKFSPHCNSAKLFPYNVQMTQ